MDNGLDPSSPPPCTYPPITLRPLPTCTVMAGCEPGQGINTRPNPPWAMAQANRSSRHVRPSVRLGYPPVAPSLARSARLSSAKTLRISIDLSNNVASCVPTPGLGSNCRGSRRHGSHGRDIHCPCNSCPSNHCLAIDLRLCTNLVHVQPIVNKSLTSSPAVGPWGENRWKRASRANASSDCAGAVIHDTMFEG